MIREKMEEYLVNIGVGSEVLLFLGVAVIALILSTRDMRIGLLSAFILYVAEFIILSQLNMNTIFALAGILLSFAFLTVSLLLKKSERGVY